MSDTYINIRFYYWHLKFYNGSFWPKVEGNAYWYEYYKDKNSLPGEPLFEVYEFFS